MDEKKERKKDVLMVKYLIYRKNVIEREKEEEADCYGLRFL